MLALFVRRLPAPIQELESPTPTVARTRAMPKPSPKSKTKPSSKPQAINTTTPASRRSGPYAGTWRGAITCGLCGDIEHRIIIDDAQQSMTVSKINSVCGSDGTATASITAEGIAVRLPGNNGKWSLKPNPNGTTARVHLTAFMLDTSAIFRREQ
jgi:hypothetical protein